jgi:signal transduction histidine kinase
MIGPLDPHLAHRLGDLALASTLPFMGAWIAGLVVILAPIDRWLARAPDTRAAPTDGEDPTGERLRAARRGASRAPRRFALLWMVTWVVPATLINYLVLVVQRDSFKLGPETWVGVAFLCAALALGSLSIAVTFMSWFLGPTMGRLSLAAHARRLGSDMGAWSLRRRTLLVALCLGLTPVLWIASITYVKTTRADAEQDSLRAELAAVQADEHQHPTVAPAQVPAGDRLGGVLRVLTDSPLAMIGFFFGVAAVYAILCASFLTGSIGTPVASIARVIREITEQGDVTDVQRIPVFQRDEVGDLVDGTNRMLDRLEEAARSSRTAEASLRQANEKLEVRVLERTSELASSNGQLEASLSELRIAQRELTRASRLGGMAEVASVVLHTIGNLLTTVNVSAEVIAELARESRALRLGEVARLLEQHKGDLAGFLERDERGRLIVPYVVALARDLAERRAAVLAEIGRLKGHLEHIMRAIGAQQSLARGGMVKVERVDPAQLVDEALQISLPGGEGIEVVRDLEEIPAASLDRHLVMQILTNVVRNAQEAVDGVAGARIALRVRSRGPDGFTIQVTDNGAGIAPENLDRIFNHGFTTKPEGNGFGLHSSACSARVMGGSLTGSSPGPGLGATFTLELPTGQSVGATAAEKQSAA